MLAPRTTLAIGSSLLTASAGSAHPLDFAEADLVKIAAEVEKACGAEFETPPVVREVSAARAMDLVARDLRPEFERRYPGATEGQMRFLLRGAASSSIRSCVARYSLTAKTILLVRSGFDRQCKALGLAAGVNEFGPRRMLLRAALAHEAVHALDDQRFDLLRLYRSTPDQEAMRALAMVTEGRAVLFGRNASREVGVPNEIRNRLPGGESPRDLREIGLHLTYAHGLRFVEHQVARGGLALADRALREPPRSTHLVCQPDRWPATKLDSRPAAVMRRLGIAEKSQALSELRLRARYASMDGLAAGEALFADYRGGRQAVVGKANFAVLAFESEAAAKAYAERSEREAVVHRAGTLVLRAAGEGSKEVIARVTAALSEDD
jgi:hypothetical protein